LEKKDLFAGFNVAGYHGKKSGRNIVNLKLGWITRVLAEIAYSAGCNEFIANPLEALKTIVAGKIV